MQGATEKNMKGKYSPYLVLKLFILSLFLLDCGGVVPAPKPQVSSNSPFDDVSGVSVNQAVIVRFNKEMDSETITPGNFFLQKAGGQQSEAGTITHGLKSSSFRPNKDLEFSTQYFVTVSAKVQDLSGQAILGKSWKFTTIDDPGLNTPPDAGRDKVPPRIVSKIPDDGTEGVSLDQVITVEFSEDIDPTTVTDAVFSINEGAKGILDSPSPKVITFTPNPKKLRPNKNYTVEIVAGVKGIRDLSGNSLSTNPNLRWSFVTGGIAPDRPDNDEN